MTYWRTSLVANRIKWLYRGVLHEYLEAPDARTSELLPGPVVRGHFDGGRSQGITTVQKYARDAETLEAALRAEPGNARYQYYLARSYRDSGQHEKAIEAFRRRATMGGFPEEVSDSLFEVAQHLERLQAAQVEIIDAYVQAWESRPTRAEPLAALARYCRETQRYGLGRIMAHAAMQIPRPATDLLWVQEDVYRWRSQDEYAICAYWTGQYRECAAASQDLLDREVLPDDQRPRVEKNLEFALGKMRELGLSRHDLSQLDLGTAAASAAPVPRQIASRSTSAAEAAT